MTDKYTDNYICLYMAATFIIHVQFQVVNYNHMMPTRYSVDISFDKTNINKELLKVNMT